MTTSLRIEELSKLRGMPLTYALMDQARQYSNVIALGRGDPDFDTPPHIVEAARDAMRHASGERPPVEGLPALRRAIAERVRTYNGIGVDPETEVVVTNGGQEAVCLMTIAALGAGDGLVVSDPNYNTYLDALRFVRGERIAVPTFARESFRIDPARVRAAVDAAPSAKAMLLVSPGNPSAAVIAPDDVRALVDLAAERGLTILADEIYDRFLYDGAEHLSPASLPDGAPRTLTLNALSKAFAMTGWRTGWVVGPAHLMARVREAKAAITGGTSVVSQYAAMAALTGPQDSVDEMRAVLARRRRIVTEAFDDLGFIYGVPQGGQFIFADASSVGISALELALRAIDEEQLLIAPGSSFGEQWASHVRVTFLQPEDVLVEAMARLKRVVARVRAQG
jgi:aspartate/methionine/tyrosine aminotransferase